MLQTMFWNKSHKRTSIILPVHHQTFVQMSLILKNYKNVLKNFIKKTIYIFSYLFSNTYFSN